MIEVFWNDEKICLSDTHVTREPLLSPEGRYLATKFTIVGLEYEEPIRDDGGLPDEVK